MCTKRHTELNLKFIQIGAMYIPKWRKAFIAVVIYIAQVGSKAILEKAQNTNEGLTHINYEHPIFIHCHALGGWQDFMWEING